MPLPDDLADTALDHIIPLARGGPTSVWNRQLLHGVCNKRKSSKLTAEAIELAALHAITLHDPLPRAWPGSTRRGGSGRHNPFRTGLPLHLQGR